MGKDLIKVNKTLYICTGGTCNRKGAMKNLKEIRAALKIKGMHDSTHTIRTLCAGQCENGPIVMVYPDNVVYKEVDIPISEKIISEHLTKEEAVKSNVLYQPDENVMHYTTWKDIAPTYRFQEVDDAQLGQIQVCKMIADETNMYALLKTIFDLKHRHFKVEIPEAGFCDYLDQAAEVVLHPEKEGFLTIQHHNFKLEWLIIYLPDTPENQPVRLHKLDKVDFYEKEDYFGIRILDKNQKLKVHITLDNPSVWKELVKIYLQLAPEKINHKDLL